MSSRTPSLNGVFYVRKNEGRALTLMSVFFHKLFTLANVV